jgi:membrane protein
MSVPRRYACMSRRTRASTAVRPGTKTVWLAALALVGTYALTRAFERNGRPSPAAPLPALPLLPEPAARSGWPRWKHIVIRTYEEIGDDRLLALAAGVVFYGLLALFPAITALVSSYALFATPATIGGHLASIASVMPSGAYGIVNEQVTRIVTGDTGGLSAAFFLGLALALWSANAGMKAIIDALNIVYGVKERRSFIRLNAISLGMTAGAIAGLLLAIAAVVALPVVTSYLPFGRLNASVLGWLRWPALLALALFGLAVLYRLGPDLDNPQWRWISPGATFAALSWLAGSALLSWYLSRFAHYDVTYGSLGAGIGLMMWLWMTSIAVLVGAEFNSEIDAADHPLRTHEQVRIGR